MKQILPISIGTGAGVGMVLAMAIFGADAMVWGLIGGAALGATFGLITTGRAPK